MCNKNIVKNLITREKFHQLKAEQGSQVVEVMNAVPSRFVSVEALMENWNRYCERLLKSKILKELQLERVMASIRSGFLYRVSPTLVLCHVAFKVYWLFASFQAI
jgi:dephospho-CoA kinase